MQITNISEAKANLSHLINELQKNKQPVIIGKAGKPVAILSPFGESNAPRTLAGRWKGKVKIADDFDESMESLFYDSPIFPESN